MNSNTQLAARSLACGRRPAALSAVVLAIVLAIVFALCLAASAPGQADELSGYSVRQLLEPCMEGDNDSRWGATAEAECEQYINGFTDAYLLLNAAQKPACLPAAGNRPDEVRWAFMRWAQRHFRERQKPAAEGLLATLRSEFKCP